MAATANCVSVPVNDTNRISIPWTLLTPRPVSRVVVLDFFFNTCEACRNNEPDLEDFVQELEGVADFYAVSIDCDPKETAKWVERYHPSYNIISDCDGKLQNLLMPEGYPANFVIDRDGYVVEKTLGYLSVENLELVGLVMTSNRDKLKDAILKVYSRP